ncbi:MAG: integration host factor, actinobacterial type [Acidimicrobiales bacterium]
MSRPPILSAEARAAALDKAAEVRRGRAEIRQMLKAGTLTLAELLERVDDDTVGKMKALAAIESLPGVGKVKARRLMDEIGIASSRRLRGVGEPQRAKLLAAAG